MTNFKQNTRSHVFTIALFLGAILSVVPVAIIYAPLIGHHKSQSFDIEPSCASAPRMNVEILKNTSDSRVSFTLSANQKDCTLTIGEPENSTIFGNQFHARFVDSSKHESSSLCKVAPSINHSKTKSDRKQMELVVPDGADFPGYWEVSFVLQDSVARTSYSDYVLLVRPNLSWPLLRQELRQKIIGEKDKRKLLVPAVLKKDYKQSISVRAPSEFVYMSSVPVQPVSVGSMEELVSTNFQIRPKGSDIQVHYKNTGNTAIESLLMFFASSFFGFSLGLIADRYLNR